MTDSLQLTILAVLIALLVAVMATCARAESCLDSASAVWAQAPRAHATWNLVDGKQCWRAGWPRPGPHLRVAKTAYGMATSRGLPLPRPRPDFELLHRDRYPQLSPQQGRTLADQLFGSPELFDFR